MVVRVV